MFKVTVRIEISLPAPELFAYVADFSNNPDWQSGIQSTEWTSPPPIGVGSTYDQQVEYRDLITTYVVTAFEPGRSITTESQEGATIPTTVTRTVEPLGESRSRITVELVGHPKAWRRLIRPYLVRTVRKSVQSDYRRLKRQREAKPEAEPEPEPEPDEE